MKNKKIIFVLIGVLVVCFIGASIFFALQGISAEKEQLQRKNAPRRVRLRWRRHPESDRG